MKTRIGIGIAGLAVLLAACATAPPFDIAPGAAATLQNRSVASAGTALGLFFVGLDERGLDAPAFRSASEASYLVPPGARQAVVLLLYDASATALAADGYQSTQVAIPVTLVAGHVYEAQAIIADDGAAITVVDRTTGAVAGGPIRGLFATAPRALTPPPVYLPR